MRKKSWEWLARKENWSCAIEGLECQEEGCRLEGGENWKTWTESLNKVCLFTHTTSLFRSWQETPGCDNQLLMT